MMTRQQQQHPKTKKKLPKMKKLLPKMKKKPPKMVVAMLPFSSVMPFAEKQEVSL